MGRVGFARSLSSLYLARVMQGIAYSFLWTSVRTITADVVAAEERGAAMGRVQEMSVRGNMLGVA